MKIKVNESKYAKNHLISSFNRILNSQLICYNEARQASKT